MQFNPKENVKPTTQPKPSHYTTTHLGPDNIWVWLNAGEITTDNGGSGIIRETSCHILPISWTVLVKNTEAMNTTLHYTTFPLPCG